ncbi:unnamed protein product [Rhodiola kirilowii]
MAFKGFPNLVRLDLWFVRIVGDMFEQVILNSPLEMREITNMHGRAQFDTNSLKVAAIAYLELEAKEEIKTSITKMSATLGRPVTTDRFEMEIEVALICRIISCSPALGYLRIDVSPSVY